jgi:hypothetical protein
MPGPPYDTNSELYADPSLTEGRDYARRHRRHEHFDDTLAGTDEVPRTVILAPHGGGIERGTSELCLAVAGYHPANLPQVPPAGVTYDYWMFEGVREGDNARRRFRLDFVAVRRDAIDRLEADQIDLRPGLRCVEPEP